MASKSFNEFRLIFVRLVTKLLESDIFGRPIQMWTQTFLQRRIHSDYILHLKRVSNLFKLVLQPPFPWESVALFVAVFLIFARDMFESSQIKKKDLLRE